MPVITIDELIEHGYHEFPVNNVLDICQRNFQKWVYGLENKKYSIIAKYYNFNNKLEQNYTSFSFNVHFYQGNSDDYIWWEVEISDQGKTLDYIETFFETQYFQMKCVPDTNNN